MKTLVIYDSTGKIWLLAHGETEVPQGLTSMFVDIPDGAILERIDVTDAENPKPVFSYLPESDIGRLQKSVKNLEYELSNTQLALCDQYEENLALQEEITNIQLALCEIYEGGV